jgi:hypothetical protein
VNSLESVGPADDGSFDLDLAAASLGADGADVQILLRALIERLRDALGERLHVERKGGFLRRSNDIRSVELRVGPDVFAATVDGTDLAVSIGRVSGGIRIRSEASTITEWLRRLLEDLQDEARHSAATRSALEQMVIGGSPEP